jgi:membrane protein DedA with SNARE-associated domain
MEFLIGVIGKAGVAGLLATMAVEGLSIPVPGILIALTLGYVLNLNIMEISLTAAGMSLVYSIASYVPYKIGYRLENVIRRKHERELQIAQNYFNKYGDFSIALLRPFAVGNYISYIAGMSKTKLLKYIALTFIGIFPWSFIVLLIGRFSKGDINIGIRLIQGYTGYIWIGALIIVLAYVGFIIFRRYRFLTRRNIT